MSNARRIGATRRADIPAAILAELNAGTIESATLAEGLAIDVGQLLQAVAPEIAADQIDPAAGITQRMQAAGLLLYNHYGPAAVDRFAGHPADTVRGWAAYLIAAVPAQALEERLAQIQPLADDSHFAVREWAWLALRPHVAADLERAIVLLSAWCTHESANIRRFACEITRPRGVWCAHIPALKAQPELGLPLLNPLRADPARYVQDSLANWLNDAAKTQAAWVVDLCADWQNTNPSPATQRICARALRNQRRG